MKSILITGCNRGLGLGLVQKLAEQKNFLQHIIATCRNPLEAKKLQEVAKSNPNKVHILQLDVKDFNAHERIAKEVATIVGQEGLNVLYNNAGISTKFTRVNMVKAEQMLENLTVNAVAPLMLTKALLPVLKQAAAANSSLPQGTSRAAIVNVSSVLGSIADNNQGGFYPYRSSKAALNAITRSLSLDLKSDNILVMSLHPGWVKTDMGGAQAPLTTETAVTAIVDLLSSVGAEHNGGFYQYDGKQLPW
ncbi:C-factor [Homalodisca vitripennis]|uniref:C-factor n=1 Tax=Homalodisca vitripennis TaxID=197043 RepID=UPI001EEA02EF|nr:C-factor [Homalodisca vitripennis]